MITDQGESGGWLSGKEPACQCRRCKRCEFDPWVRKIPWRRAWQPTPVFLAGESHGQRSLVGCSPRGCKETRRSDSTTTTKARRWTRKMYLLICWYLTLKANSSQWITHGDWSVSFACLWTSYLLSYHHSLPFLFPPWNIYWMYSYLMKSTSMLIPKVEFSKG